MTDSETGSVMTERKVDEEEEVNNVDDGETFEEELKVDSEDSFEKSSIYEENSWGQHSETEGPDGFTLKSKKVRIINDSLLD